MTYDVHTDHLRGASRSTGTSSSGIATLSTDLARALRALGTATGSPDIATTADELARGWGRTTGGMLSEARGLTRGLSVSATRYDHAERGLRRGSER